MDSLYAYESPSMSQNSPMINYRKDAKKGVKFTFMVVGELGTGKTTFINSLLNKKVLSHRYEAASGHAKTVGETKTLTFTSAKSVALPNTAILTKHEFNPRTVNEEPGIALTETKVEMIDDDNMKLLLNIIDTPGFGENLNNELCFVEIENYLKQQFDLVLAEETRIKRNPRFVDTRVHVLLYFITPTGHGLREIDIQCMKRLSKYVNIIPVIGKADSFTESELKHFKTQIKIDIKKFNVPIFQFDNYLNEYDEDEDHELIQECKFLANLQPFAIISSEHEFEVRDSRNGQTRIIKGRQYPWGLVDINDPKYSDFPILKSVILGSHLQDLKDLTHDFLYETYRTERLTKVTAGSNGKNAAEEEYDDSEFHDTVEHHQDNSTKNSNHYYNDTVPSMSNLAQITNASGSELTEANGDDSSITSADSSVKKSKSMLLEDESNEMPSPKLKDSPSFSSSTSTLSLEHHVPHTNFNKSEYLPPPRNLNPNNTAFKRLSIGPQRNQLRQISETVPYVIRHERILERQQKLEEMEMASAKELASRAALLEQKAAELKAKEKSLMKRLELERQRKLAVESPTKSESTVEDPPVAEDQSLAETESVNTLGRAETDTEA
ncbi:Septin [Suhomyces tanzawaensis NRRL Y-17324]|uniref:Septin n=1 Tax=Suhomyces tanzawaensis NRRL Y-17324 TaxID=984487 RepID=A0A1E4SJ26_9ASCO|nr:Septin [Suhomyces tanzawaensis NRRL Y-17324]ODV79498.1 Septin [Suhomyces tanzawaensis NRRL Y-17324]